MTYFLSLPPRPELKFAIHTDDLRLDRVLTGADGLDIINEFVKVFGMAACVLDAESVG